MAEKACFGDCHVVVSQNQILDTVLLNLFLEPGVVVCKGLDLKTQSDVDLITKLVPEALDGCDIVLKLAGVHAVSVYGRVLVWPWGMVGKAEQGKALIYGLLDIVSVLALGMVASVGMGMVILHERKATTIVVFTQLS